MAGKGKGTFRSPGQRHLSGRCHLKSRRKHFAFGGFCDIRRDLHRKTGAPFLPEMPPFGRLRDTPEAGLPTDSTKR